MDSVTNQMRNMNDEIINFVKDLDKLEVDCKEKECSTEIVDVESMGVKDDLAVETTLNEKGREHIKKGEWEKAIQCYMEAIKLSPTNAKFYNNRAYCYQMTQQYKLSMCDCNVGLRLDPMYIKLYVRRACLFEKLQQYENSFMDLKKVLSMDPNSDKAYEHLLRISKKIHNEQLLKDVKECLDRTLKERLTQDTLHMPGSLEECLTRDPLSVPGSMEDPVGNDEETVEPIYLKPHNRSKVRLNCITIKEAYTQTLEEPIPVNEEFPDNMAINSFVDFLYEWMRLHKNEEALYTFLKNLDGSSFPTIFGMSLDTQIFCEIINVLNIFKIRGESIYPYLKGLSQVQRIKTISSFMSEPERKSLEALILYMVEKKECPPEEGNLIQQSFSLNI